MSENLKTAELASLDSDQAELGQLSTDALADIVQARLDAAEAGQFDKQNVSIDTETPQSRLDDAEAAIKALDSHSSSHEIDLASEALLAAQAEKQSIVQFEDATLPKASEVAPSRLVVAEAAVSDLNFKSSATDRVRANSEFQLAKQEQKNRLANGTPDYSEIGDLIRIGKNNKTFHRPDGGFLTKEALQAVYDNQAQIREGIDGLKTLEAQAELAPAFENGESADSQAKEVLDLSGLDVEDNPDKINIVELYNSLENSSDRYAELTAKDRQSYFGRFAKEGQLGQDSRFGKLLRKIPGVGGLIDSINDKQSEEINQAIAHYETATKAYLAGYEELLRSDQVSELSEEEISVARIAERINIDYSLELSIVVGRKEQGKAAGKFTNWWVSQKGFSGNLKKAGVVLGAGFIAGGLAATGIGAAGGVATLGWIGSTVAGGAAGAGIAHSTTRRRANATVKGSEQTLAQTDSAVDHEAKAGLLNAAESTDTRVDIDYTEKQTAKEMLRNRKRVKIATSLGATAGGMAFKLEQAVAQAVNPGSAVTSPTYPLNTPKSPSGSKVTELLGHNFNVESGHGLTNEWMDWAHTNGHALNSHDAYDLHKAVRAQFGDSGIIDKVGTYVQNGDLRLAKPGAAQWDKGVAEFAKNWLSARGKW